MPETEHRLSLLKPNERKAYDLRKSGSDYHHIAAELGVGYQRALQITRRANWVINERDTHWAGGLSVRVANCLNWMDVKSREEALQAFTSGRLKPGKEPRNYGWKSHVELAKWLGLPEPQKPVFIPKPPMICPHCQKEIS
jgi:hypothetical protein